MVGIDVGPVLKVEESAVTRGQGQGLTHIQGQAGRFAQSALCLCVGVGNWESFGVGEGGERSGLLISSTSQTVDGHGVLATAHWVLGFWKFLGRTWWGRSQQLRDVTRLAPPWPQGCPAYTLQMWRAVRALTLRRRSRESKWRLQTLKCEEVGLSWW